MSLPLKHKDTATFIKVSTGAYGNKKIADEQQDVKCTFLQSTGFVHTTNQDLLDSDAIIYVDHNNAWIKDNHHRIEGMIVVVRLYGSTLAESFYKVESVTVNRDHLLKNKIDNILCTLKKTEAIGGVS